MPGNCLATSRPRLKVSIHDRKKCMRKIMGDIIFLCNNVDEKLTVCVCARETLVSLPWNGTKRLRSSPCTSVLSPLFCSSVSILWSQPLQQKPQSRYVRVNKPLKPIEVFKYRRATAREPAQRALTRDPELRPEGQM